MTTITESSYHYSDKQISAWLRGLLTIAWADGHFDPEEKELLAELTQSELAPKTQLGELDTIAPDDLAQGLGSDHTTRENFLRTAVMMAIANGVYSSEEAKQINDFREALGLEIKELEALKITLCDLEQIKQGEFQESGQHPPDLLNPVKKWLDGIEIKDPRLARFVCKMIPQACPFERDVKIFGKKIVHIPAMCEINPLYEQLIGLRFRSLSYLADECKEDVSKYL
jgi:tellurite resistance protein